MHNRALKDLEVTPEFAAQSRQALIVDVRPAQERWLGMGAIPGSLEVLGSPFEQVEALSGSQQSLILVCQSGRRSLELARQTRTGNVYSLAGGVLGWDYAGYPLCALGQDLQALAQSDARPKGLEALRRSLLACFVAEIAEITDCQVDPAQLLACCFEDAKVEAKTANVKELVGVMSWAAARSREFGNDYVRIADNLEMFLRELATLLREQPRRASSSA